MQIDMVQGTLDMLILKTLAWGPLHGYGIARWLEQTTEDALRIEEGSLYPALYRLARKGLVTAEWRVNENNRRARYYTLTTAGRKHLRAETAAWGRFVIAVAKVLEAQPA
jgi:transcriptional regulator